MKFFAMLAVVFVLAPMSAHAIPVTWNLTSTSYLGGSYDFDADTNLFSNVMLINAFGDDEHTSLSGNAQMFGGFSSVFGDNLMISLAAPMINAGGMIAFTYTDSYTGDGSGTITSDGANVSVPEPATMTLLGLGLLGLGWTRRKTS